MIEEMPLTFQVAFAYLDSLPDVCEEEEEPKHIRKKEKPKKKAKPLMDLAKKPFKRLKNKPRSP